MMESDDEEEGDQEFPVEISKQELVTAVRSMSTKLEDLRTCNDLIAKHGHALQRSVTDLTQSQGKKWQRLLGHEREQRLRLEEMVEQLARQHSHLEHQCKKTNMSSLERGLKAAELNNHHRSASSVSNISTGGLEVKDDLKSSECTTDDEDEFLDAVTEP